MYSYWHHDGLALGLFFYNRRLRISPWINWTVVIELEGSHGHWGVDVKPSLPVVLMCWLCGAHLKEDCAWFRSEENGKHFAWILNAYSRRHHFTCQDYIPF